MLFSLIIPVYNTEKYLRNCLESVEAQEFDDFEVILVDDGSTDNSPAMCDAFCEKFNNRPGRKSTAKVIHQKNKGLSGARNSGIREAVGEWLWFVDSDDWITQDALAAIYERMSFAKADLYTFQSIKTDENKGNEEYLYFRVEQEKLRFPDEESLFSYYTERLFCYKDGWETHTRLYRRDIIADNNLRYYETPFNFGEDLVFYTEYLLCAKSVVMLVNYLYFYRQQSSSIMHTLDQKSIIPKLIILLEDIYLEAGRLNRRYVCKHFDKVCLAVFSHHIEFKLDELTDEEIGSEIGEGTKNKEIGKYISAVSGLLEQAAHDRHKV